MSLVQNMTALVGGGGGGRGANGGSKSLGLEFGIIRGDQFSCLGFLHTLQEWNGETLMGKQGYSYVPCMSNNSYVKEKNLRTLQQLNPTRRGLCPRKALGYQPRDSQEGMQSKTLTESFGVLS